MSDDGESRAERITGIVVKAIFYGAMVAGAIYLFFQFSTISAIERGIWLLFAVMLYNNYVLGKKLDEIHAAIREIRYYVRRD